MSLVHLAVTRVTGYDLFTLYFDNREEGAEAESAFRAFEKEFAPQDHSVQVHPEHTYSLSYYGYFIFPNISSDDIYELYKNRCESRPNLDRRYNIYFDKEHVHLEKMIRKFDRPIEIFVDARQKFKTYCHRLDYLERSTQILRDIQTAIYETETRIAAKELELHKGYLESISEAGD